MPQNPKDKRAKTKVSFTRIPTTALVHLAIAIEDGDKMFAKLEHRPIEYYDWRKKQVKANIYVDAILRHTLAWWEGEDDDPEHKISHLGKVMASAAILLDAQECGNIQDMRGAVNTPQPSFNQIYARRKRWSYTLKKIKSV